MNVKLFDVNKTRLTLVQHNSGINFNWIFLPGGPGIDSGYYLELVSLLELPGNIWLIDLPENGSNKSNTQYQPDYDFDRWSLYLKQVITSLDNVILVGHSFSGLYPLLFPEIISNIQAFIIICSASRPWVDNAIKKSTEKNLPNFEKELANFLQLKTKDSFEKVLNVFVHYYFSPETISEDCKILHREEWNFYALNWWLSKASSIDFDRITIPDIPTLIIGGSEDCAVPFDNYIKDNRFNNSNSVIQEIKGAYHFPWLDKPNEIKTLIEEFVKRLSEEYPKKQNNRNIF